MVCPRGSAVNINFRSQLGWLEKKFHKWHSHYWRILTFVFWNLFVKLTKNNHMSDQKSLFIIHISFYILYALTWTITQGMWWKLFMTHRFAIFVCDGSVDCIVLSSNTYHDVIWPVVHGTFLDWSHAFSRRQQVDYHSLIIKSYPPLFQSRSCMTMKGTRIIATDTLFRKQLV